MQVPVRAHLYLVVGVGLGLLIHRDQNELAMPYTALRDDVVSEMPDFVDRATQDGDLHAAVVIQMHVHRRDREVVVIMRGVRQSARKLSSLVVIDINERAQAVGVLGP